MITESDLRSALTRALTGGVASGTGVPPGLRAALVSEDVTSLKEALQSIGREVAGAGRPLSPVLDSWEVLVAEAAAGLHVATRGAAWLAKGYAEAKSRRVGDSLQQATDSLASRKAELSALHRVNAAANSSLDENAILSTVVQVVAEVTYAAVCSIYLLHPPNTLVLAATRGLNPNAVGRARMQIGEGVTGWAIGSDKVPDAAAHATDLYRKLEEIVLPLYYCDRARWVWMMKQAIGKIGSVFNSQRMMRRYTTEAYVRH